MPWWTEVASLGSWLSLVEASEIDPSVTIEPGAMLDDSTGPIVIAARTKVCSGAVIRGPVRIGEDCLVGNSAVVRGPTLVGDRVRIGFAAELKQAMVSSDVAIGPMCFVADSKVDEGAYLGAQVRTSNQRLDRAEICVREDGIDVATGTDKLGCWIGAGASLGIQVIVLPGRTVAPGSLFEPRITIAQNLPAGRYRAVQALETLPI